MKTLRLGTRKSALAQAQARWVAERLRQAFPDLQVELRLITTSGDKIPSPQPSPEKGEGAVPSPTSGEGGRRPGEGKGGLKALFTKELEDALLDKRIDLAVHSLKDMAAQLPKGLQIGAVPEREDPRDVWISRNKLPFQHLPQGAKVGTGAVRRQAQLRHARPDLELVPLRGNVDTRLRQISEGNLDGIILALAGLKRLGRSAEATEILPPTLMLPAVGQGCLAIESRQADAAVAKYLKELDHPTSHQAVLAERAFLAALGGSCQTPIAGHAYMEGAQLTMIGLVISPDGQQAFRGKESGRPFDASGVGERMAQKLLAAGADKILGL
jgi:hydroxymethylbilane synthase